MEESSSELQIKVNEISTSTTESNSVIVENKTEFKQEKYIFEKKEEFIFWTRYMEMTYDMIYCHIHQNIRNYRCNSINQLNDFQNMLEHIKKSLTSLILHTIIISEVEFEIRKQESNELFYKHLNIINKFYTFFKLKNYDLYNRSYTEDIFKHYENFRTKNITFENLNSKYLNDMIPVLNSI